jgi:hypothetical protein
MKKSYYIICIICILLILFISKFLTYNKYQNKQEIIISNDGNITILHKDVKNYLTYNGIKIRNDFNKYEYEKSDDTYILYDKDEDIINMFSIFKVETLIDVFKKFDDTLSEKEINKFLKDNNINNDIELLDYISNYSKNINLFSSNYDIKLNDYIRRYINEVMPLIYEYKVIDGDYYGIVTYNLNYEEEKTIEVMLLKNNVRYIISYIGSEIEEKYVLDLIGTVIFDEEE